MKEYGVHHRISEIIGGSVTPERVSALIREMKQGGHIVHGVKSQTSLPSIIREGIKPLTPESQFGSHWTSGKRVFSASANPHSGLFGYDSSFFHYWGSMLALTNLDILERYKIDYEVSLDEEHLTIRQVVPRSAIAILKCEGLVPRFEILEKAVKKGYRGGELFITDLEKTTFM